MRQMKQQKISKSMQRAMCLYTCILCLYPKEHRRAYGSLMLQTFKDYYCDAQRDKGTIGWMFWLHVIEDETRSLLREHMENIRGEKSMKHPILKVYFFLFAAFTVLLAVMTWFDLTHAGDVLNILFGLIASVGLYCYLFRKSILTKRYWLLLMVMLALYNISIILFVLVTPSQPYGFSWFFGSTATTSKIYEIIAIAFGLPALWSMYRLSRPAKE